MRKALVIGGQTVQAFSRDRIFFAGLIFAVLILMFAVFLGSLSAIENRKILLDFGLAATSMVGIGFSLLIGSTLVRKEIDSRTIYTILSKPVRRAEYLWGKVIGGAFVVITMHLVCAATLGLAVVIDGQKIPLGFCAAIYLMVLEGLIVMALSLFLSLVCSSIVLSASLAFAAFLIGRSSYALYLVTQKASGPARSIAGFIYTIFPSLQRFDIREVVAYGKAYPDGMIAVSSGYFAAYLLVLMLLSILVMSKKDLN
jgi:Cu-processing system permease protein